MPFFKVKIAELRTRTVEAPSLKELEARVKAQCRQHQGTPLEFMLISIHRADQPKEEECQPQTS